MIHLNVEDNDAYTPEAVAFKLLNLAMKLDVRLMVRCRHTRVSVQPHDKPDTIVRALEHGRAYTPIHSAPAEYLKPNPHEVSDGQAFVNRNAKEILNIAAKHGVAQRVDHDGMLLNFLADVMENVK